jgi:hypothetical protein
MGGRGGRGCAQAGGRARAGRGAGLVRGAQALGTSAMAAPLLHRRFDVIGGLVYFLLVSVDLRRPAASEGVAAAKAQHTARQPVRSLATSCAGCVAARLCPGPPSRPRRPLCASLLANHPCILPKCVFYHVRSITCRWSRCCRAAATWPRCSRPRRRVSAPGTGADGADAPNLLPQPHMPPAQPYMASAPPNRTASDHES